MDTALEDRLSHLAVDGRGRALSVLISPGQAGDNPQLLPVLGAIAIGSLGGGRPRKRPDLLLADKGCALDSTRAALASASSPPSSGLHDRQDRP